MRPCGTERHRVRADMLASLMNPEDEVGQNRDEESQTDKKRTPEIVYSSVPQCRTVYRYHLPKLPGSRVEIRVRRF
jgi:hypothetical protein